jgi:hypothetical protein
MATLNVTQRRLVQQLDLIYKNDFQGSVPQIANRALPNFQISGTMRDKGGSYNRGRI